MKKVISLGMIACVTIAMLSCKKSDTGPSVISETPAKTTIANRTVVDTTDKRNNGSYEFGQKFYVSNNGNITKLGCKMAATGNFRVSLWDYSTTNLIAATTVSVTDTLNFFYNTVSAIPVTANTRYVISLNNTDAGVNKLYFAYYKKPGFTPVTFPFTTGSVTYEAGLYSASATSVFPATAFNDAFWGVPDFQFEYTQ